MVARGRTGRRRGLPGHSVGRSGVARPAKGYITNRGWGHSAGPEEVRETAPDARNGRGGR